MIDESRETPLTDAVEQKFRLLKLNPATAALQLARKLERALAAAKAEVERVVGEKDEADKLVNCLRLENRDLKDALIFEIEKRQAAETALRKEREKVIEECAKAAEQQPFVHKNGVPVFPSDCARAIRALKDKP